MCNVKVKVNKNDSKHCVKVTDVDTGTVSSFFSETFVSGMNLAMSWSDVDVEFNEEDSVKDVLKALKKAKDVHGEDCAIKVSVDA